MASSKELQHSLRPLNQHRLSVSTGSSLPVRISHSRNHSHSVSAGPLNLNHRITRRKSMSANATTVAAVAAAARESGDSSFAMAIPISSRRSTMSRGAGSKSIGIATPPSSLPIHRMSLVASRHKIDADESAIDDDQNDDMGEEDTSLSMSRMRRASEGQQLIKGDGKKANANDLKCEKCGKGYKHSSCLTKHLWEHTPEWSYTSKLLISKHQQVQLLEAASVLVAMNQDGTTPPDSAKDFQSDHDSSSPAASGSSGHRDDSSSAGTTPPPQTDIQIAHSYTSSSFTGRTKRHSSGNSYSRSYQSASSCNPPYEGSAPNGYEFSYYGQQSGDRGSISSGRSSGSQEDEAGLAAAVELLSCSFGTPRSGPVTFPTDVPPVPPLPACYQNQNALSGITLTTSPHVQVAATSYVRGGNYRDKDIKIEESEESVMDDEEYDSQSRGRIDEDDDGVFGRMEE